METPSPHVYFFETLCPKLIGSLFATLSWAVWAFNGLGWYAVHISKAPQWRQNPLLKTPPHPECLGFHNGKERLSSALWRFAFLRQGVPPFARRPQSCIEARDHPIPAPRETWRHARGSDLPITSPGGTDSWLWSPRSQDEPWPCRKMVLGRCLCQGQVSEKWCCLRIWNNSSYHVSSPKMPRSSPKIARDIPGGDGRTTGEWACHSRGTVDLEGIWEVVRSTTVRNAGIPLWPSRQAPIGGSVGGVLPGAQPSRHLLLLAGALRTPAIPRLERF